MLYFPDPDPDSEPRDPDRTYMFNILQTKRPEYTHKLLQNAHSQRYSINPGVPNGEEIVMSQSWQ